MRHVLFALFGLSALAVTPASSEAQGEHEGSRVVQLDEFVVYGRPQKPSAFYILHRSRLGSEILDLRASFVREIVRSAEDDAL